MIGLASEVEYLESVIPPIVDEKAQTNQCENQQMLTLANEAAIENNKGDAVRRVYEIIGEVASHLTELQSKLVGRPPVLGNFLSCKTTPGSSRAFFNVN